MRALLLLVVVGIMAGCDRGKGTTEAKPVAAASTAPPKNAEWERKSRAKLAEGLEKLKAGAGLLENRLAVSTMQYAYADVPPVSELTAQQKELLLEVSVRSSIAAIYLDDNESSKKYAAMSNDLRRSIGMDKDQFDAWCAPILADMARRMNRKN